ncbi:hypothetical protein LZ30DRAFT_604045 [Colletotrichum cereale]|nr:hypothetical protein LZ30DRAFT_604045 [Colletotrichum cereale]
MTYDVYGMWDEDKSWAGPYLKGHTDWRKIDQGPDLRWQNGDKPENFVMGFGFYGCQSTMSDTNCIQMDGVCQFLKGGSPGSCFDTARCAHIL